ncbi:hypothetical protein [Citrobacter braakii]|uniref:hypothetical protein n=1 Tax=Citrobacter braakii TaxID=57706 RepID=UPI00351D1CCD
MRYESKQLFMMFIDISNEQIPALRQKYTEIEKNAFDNAVNKKEEYQPHFMELMSLSEQISQINSDIDKYEKCISDIDHKITLALADISLIMKLKSESGDYSCKINALNAAKDNILDDIAINKMVSYHAYREYFEAVREYTRAHEIRVTGDFIFTLREMIARSMVECSAQRGDTEVLHAAVYDYTKKLTPSDGNYNRKVDELRNNAANEFSHHENTESSLGELIGKYFTEEPDRHYESAICLAAVDASRRRKRN